MNTANSNGLYTFGMLAVMFALLYFLMIRPQRKKEKADQEMRASLRVGDEVITIGGIVGKVEKITDKTVVISTTAGKNKIEFLKSSIATVTKSTQTNAAAAKEVAKAEKEESKPNRDKKVTPKKLGKKSEAENDTTADAENAE